jgi:D-3-phosphoglycerate dehydrogenase
MVVGTANSVTVAEHAVFMMYGLAKKAFFHDAAGAREPLARPLEGRADRSAGKTILIVGFGASVRARPSAASRWK